MKNDMDIREYLQELSDEELDSLELEVLHATKSAKDNQYLETINQEKKYREFRNLYYRLKDGVIEDRYKFINTDNLDLLTIYKKQEQGRLYTYLESLSLIELIEIRKRLLKTYKFYKKDPIIMEINKFIKSKKDEEMTDEELEIFIDKEERLSEIRKVLPQTLLEYYHKQGLTDYLKGLTDEELLNAERCVSVTDITGDNEKLYDAIRQENEYRSENKGKSM